MCHSVSSLPEEFISTYTFFFFNFTPFASDIWSSFHACFLFFSNAEFSDFQMQSPGRLNNEANHKITRDIAGSLEIQPQQLWELQTWSHPGPLLLHLWHPISHEVPSILFLNITVFLVWIFKKSVLNLLQYCLYFLISWFFGHESSGILPFQPGIKPASPPLEGEGLTTGPTRKVPASILIFKHL